MSLKAHEDIEDIIRSHVKDYKLQLANIIRQYLWFYKNGKIITQGSVVTGNPNRGRSTVLGTYMLNYRVVTESNM